MRKIEKETFISIFTNSQSCRDAAKKMNLSYGTCKRHAVKFGIFKANQGGKGIKKHSGKKIPLDDIITNKVVYQTFKLKNRLYKDGLKQNICEICGIKEWNGKPLQCQLDHIDGNRYNNNLENLRIICPNCHSQTETFCSKNWKNCAGGRT